MLTLLWLRDDDDQEEPTNLDAIRGIYNAILFSIPFWLVIFAVINRFF